MRKVKRLILVMILVCAAPALLIQAAAVKIMPLGDSITGSPGCWRAKLWTRLQSSGYTNIDFVGTLSGQGCGVTYDSDCEGHGGFLATNIASQNQLPGWLSATNPNIVIMHLGTNDVWNGIAPATILSAFSTLVDQMRANNGSMKIIVAKIIPMNPSSCTACAQRVIDFNNAIPAWASGKSTSQSPITVVDQWTGFNTATDTGDGVHPNDAGNQKMSDKWYPALVSALNGTTPTANPTVSRTATRTATATVASRTATRTATTATRTATPVTTTSGTLCTPSGSITIPYVKDGSGEFCWETTALGSYINSWNLDLLEVNGVNYTNKWASASSIAKVNNKYVIHYKTAVAWGHFEAK